MALPIEGHVCNLWLLRSLGSVLSKRSTLIEYDAINVSPNSHVHVLCTGVCPSAEQRRTIVWLSPCWLSGFLLPASALNFLSMYVYVYLQFSFICRLFSWILPVLLLIFHPNPSSSLGTVNWLLVWSFLLSQDVRPRVFSYVNGSLLRYLHALWNSIVAPRSFFLVSNTPWKTFIVAFTNLVSRICLFRYFKKYDLNKISNTTL